MHPRCPRAEPWVGGGGGLTVESASVAFASPASITSLGPLVLGSDCGLTTRDEGPRQRLLTSGLKGMDGSPNSPLLMVAYDETHFTLLTFYKT
jgi:hypothetical protein